jgi:predicted metal-binding membrane protein
MAKTSDPVLSNPAPGPAWWRGRVRPRVLAVLSIALLAALGWIYLGLMIGAHAHAGLAPGASLLELLAAARVDAIGRALFDALCRPTFGESHAGMHALIGGAELPVLYLMWGAMTFAMMLPTAAPMTLAYADIAETAAGRRERVVSPLVLTFGYGAVWLGFAAAATLLQWALGRVALLDPALPAANGLFAGAIFLGAGAYQFSALKHACLTQCQRPLPFFLANWSTRPGDVFRLGLRQGVYCLGCCWAMMLVMFAVGVMNVVWMALLGAIMGLEKVMVTSRFSRAIGIILITVGVIFVATSVTEHWPVRGG